jgi:hypothetical protein
MATKYRDLYNFLMKLNSDQMDEECAFTSGQTTYNIDSMDIVGETHKDKADASVDLNGLIDTAKPLAPYGANTSENATVTDHLGTGYDLTLSGTGTVSIVIS